MFTGIVRGIGHVSWVKLTQDLMSCKIEFPPDLIGGLEHGASVAVDGVCLTVTGWHELKVAFDVIPETLSRTTLGQLKAGDHVNLERAARLGDEIGGHLLSGHVYGVGRIARMDHVLEVTCDPTWMKYILPKGYVALNGCSLTVVDVHSNGFTVHLIPETLRATTFSSKNVGDHVNIEFDAMTQAVVDTVERMNKN